MRFVRMNRTLVATAIVLAAIFTTPGAAVRSALADEALGLIEGRRVAGELHDVDAAFLAVQRIFEPEELPVELRLLSGDPLRCATAVLRDALPRLTDLDPDRREKIDGWMRRGRSVRQRSASYLSPSGIFALNFETSGPDSVPITDTSPANGIPDFVERVAQYLDLAWDVQVAQMGFTAPDVISEPYPVNFAQISGYGYTTNLDAGPAGTRIVLHRNFEGFRVNDDPEGSPSGSAKVTCAHELRHAVQFATSGWTEPGLWVELDATWIEDLVFDEVNDYIYYLGSSSPISSPQLPLDSGGSGSYPENCFQHWMFETHGLDVIHAYWNRRNAMPAEPVLDSYDFALQSFGSSLLEDYVTFAAWNQQTGTRALSGFGYEEADQFPDAPISGNSTTVPVQFSSYVDHLSSKTLRISGFEGNPRGVIDVRVVRSGNSPIRVAAILQKHDGQRQVELLPLSSTDESVTLSVSSSFVAGLEIVVANGQPGSGLEPYSIFVEERTEFPVAIPAITPSATSIDVTSGTDRSVVVDLQNSALGSAPLEFEAHLIHPFPQARMRNIAGSTLAVDFDTYTPGATLTRGFIVRNGGTSFEWLSRVDVTLPAGVSVISSTNMVSESGQVLTSNGATGEAITLSWTDPDGLWGQVMAGETALGSIALAFDPDITADLTLDYRIYGDGFGTSPHQVVGSIELRGPDNPFLEIGLPSSNGIVLVDQTTAINWSAAGVSDVAIDLSRDGGVTWETLVASTSNDGNWSWNATGPASAECLLRVHAVGDASQARVLPSPFALVELSALGRVSPTTGSVAEGTTEVLSIDVDAGALTPGVYDALLYVRHNGLGPPLTLPVQANVTDSATDSGTLPARTRVLGAVPNPFNPSTQIRLELATDSEVSIDIHDSRGRLVRQLLHRTLPVGHHGIAWDGRDDHARAVASGAYYFSVSIDGSVSTGKMLLVK